MANYMLVGARQLGDTLFEVQDGKMTLNFDKDVARKLWDNYYVPFVKGWFAAIGRFRSDDIKVGNVLAYVGSNSSATFFPAQVMVNDTESYDIDMTVLPSPKFAGGEDVAVQQDVYKRQAGPAPTWHPRSPRRSRFPECRRCAPAPPDTGRTGAERSFCRPPETR